MCVCVRLCTCVCMRVWLKANITLPLALYFILTLDFSFIVHLAPWLSVPSLPPLSLYLLLPSILPSSLSLPSTSLFCVTSSPRLLYPSSAPVLLSTCQINIQWMCFDLWIILLLAAWKSKRQKCFLCYQIVRINVCVHMFAYYICSPLDMSMQVLVVVFFKIVYLWAPPPCVCLC